MRQKNAQKKLIEILKIKRDSNISETKKNKEQNKKRALSECKMYNTNKKKD
jgi:hypothetical protein